MLRTFVSESGGKMSLGSAYDIEVDDEGIYVVGRTSYAESRIVPTLLILKRNHELRCSNAIDFWFEQTTESGTGRIQVPESLVVSLEVNQTHVIVAGALNIPPGGGKAAFTGMGVFIAAFTKNDCKLTGYYVVPILIDKLWWDIVERFGEGVEVAMYSEDIYLLVGNSTGRDGFLVMEFDQYLNPVKRVYYYVESPTTDFAMSIAVDEDYVYVVGGKKFDAESFRFKDPNIFLIQLNRADLSIKETVNLQPAPLPRSFPGYPPAMDVVVEPSGNIYWVYTVQSGLIADTVSIAKLDKNLRTVWINDYVLNYTYFDPIVDNRPPVHVVMDVAYGVSAAVSDSYLFVGGFIIPASSSGQEPPKGGAGQDPSGPEQEESGDGGKKEGGKDEIVKGMFFAVDKVSGEALFGFRIEDSEAREDYSKVFGVDAEGSCVYLAGNSQMYRLEYVYMNNYESMSRSSPVSGDATSNTGGMDELSVSGQQLASSIVFDKDFGTTQYGFYGVFCPGRISSVTTTTVSSTVYTTSTTVSTQVETSTVYTTSTTVSTRVVEEYTTSTTVSTQVQTRTFEERRVILNTIYTTREIFMTSFVREVETFRTTLTDFVMVTLTNFGAGAPAQFGNATKTVTTTAVTTTTFVRDSMSYPAGAGSVERLSELPPWFYLPFLLLPIPLAAVLLQGRRQVVVIRKTSQPPPGWSDDKPPIVDDLYLKPSVTNIKKGASVVFVNEDD
ncbi:MAG: hypothetical protein NZ941_00555, partial [Candidatus Caldarchaeum sp.]|nr:hypothetical protein [Candidatus Caldarchaeum sp.]